VHLSLSSEIWYQILSVPLEMFDGYFWYWIFWLSCRR